MDLHPVGAGSHELGVRRVPDVFDVDHRLAGFPKGIEDAAGGGSRSLRLDQRIGPAGEVVALDVDDQERPRHEVVYGRR